jgi:hypothetical protein
MNGICSDKGPSRSKRYLRVYRDEEEDGKTKTVMCGRC